MHRTSARFALTALSLTALCLAACFTVPITGKRSFISLPAAQDGPLGEASYEQILAEEQVIRSGPQLAMVERVVGRLVEVVKRDGLEPAEFDWQVALLDNDSVANAFCLPGGKMAVYTGILPLTKNDAGLAAVMGHEIGHALARHGAERYTQQMWKELGFQVGTVLWPETQPYAESVNMATELFLFLPFGRADELEADEIGLILMARAGYDPQEAVEFWKRMSAVSGESGPALLSTHPSNAQRIEQLEQLLPEARAEFDAARGSN